MPRKVSLPGAAELFRPTHSEDDVVLEPAAGSPSPDASGAPVRPSGRIRHDEKITVYVSSAELLALEQARLRLRAEYGVAVDRGRVVREAIGAMIDGLEADGESSQLVQRLRSK